MPNCTGWDTKGTDNWEGHVMTNDQSRNQGQQGSGQQDQQCPGQQSGQQQRQSGSQSRTDDENQYNRPGKGGQQNKGEQK